MLFWQLMRPRSPAKRALIALLIVVLLGVGIFFILPLAVEPIIARKLHAAVSEHTESELSIGSLTYRPPFRVILYDARLTDRSDPHQVRMLHVPKLDLRLAELPFGPGPIVIASLDVREPSFRITTTPPVWPDDQDEEQEDEPDGPPPKLSQHFELRRFKLEGGSIVLDDRTREDVAPMTWGGIDIDMHTEPQTRQLYEYTLQAGSSSMLSISSRGLLHIDELMLEMQELALELKVEQDAPQSQLPAAVQEVLNRYQISGALRIDGQGRLPMREAELSTFDLVLDMSRAQGQVPDSRVKLEQLATRLRCARPAVDPDGGGVIEVVIESLDATLPDTTVHLGETAGSYEPQRKAWRMPNIAGELRTRGRDVAGVLRFAGGGQGVLGARREYELRLDAQDYAFQPKDFPLPLERVRGTVHIVNDHANARELSALYGGDEVRVTRGHVSLQEAPRRFLISELVGGLRFTQPGPEYPKPLTNIVQDLRPAGWFDVAGRIIVDRSSGEKARTDYELAVETNDSSFAPTERRMPLTAVVGRAHFATQRITLDEVTGTLMGGRFRVAGQIMPRKPGDYAIDVDVRGVNLRELVHVYEIGDGSLSGSIVARGTVRGRRGDEQGAAMDHLSGDGEAEIVRGNLWQIPLFGALAAQAKVKTDALTAGDAAALLRIERRTIHLRNAALSSPVLGLQGQGSVGFDGRLSLDVIAAPLGSWKRGMQRTGIPIISDAVGEVVGAVQTLLNTATEQLLYQFRVSGYPREPKIEVVPVPALTDTAAYIFGGMVKEQRRERELLESLRTSDESASD